MKIDARMLLAALEDRRTALAQLAGHDKPLNWVEVSAQTGLYPSLFTRIKNGSVPDEANLAKLATWLNRDVAEFEACGDCPAEDLTGTPAALLAEDSDDGDPDPEEPDTDEGADDPDPEERTAAIVATGGHLHESNDPETAAAIDRVRELFAEGMARVSIGASMDSEKMPDKELLDELIAAEKWEEAEALLAEVPFMIQHLAVVDTPAFVKANPTLDDDGNITGPITFEGLWTGDMRFFPLDSFTWEAALPIPIIWNRDAGDHTGTIVGTISGLERVYGEASQPDDAVSASIGVAGVDEIPAKYVAKPKPGPLTITPPDENGLRHIFGTAAPAGVCHPNPKYGTQCFTYPGDADPQLRRFNSGMPRRLSDGTTVRLGALTMFGLHASTASMMKPGVTSTDLAKYEDGREIFAAVRGYDDPAGMLVAGIVMPDVTDAQLQRAMTMGASVEMSPTRHGRNVVGAHLVPTQAWPVAASGAAMTGPEPMILGEEIDPEEEAAEIALASGKPGPVNMTVINEGGKELAEHLSAIEAKLDQMSTALALVAGQVLDFPEPADETGTE